MILISWLFFLPKKRRVLSHPPSCCSFQLLLFAIINIETGLDDVPHPGFIIPVSRDAWNLGETSLNHIICISLEFEAKVTQKFKISSINHNFLLHIIKDKTTCNSYKKCNCLNYNIFT